MKINVRGVSWHYDVVGQGTPLLFLHGGFDSGANYTILLEEFAQHFQVISVDRRGHGRSADNNLPFDYPLMADEVLAFTMELGLSPFHVVGYSDGANIGLHLASKNPEKVNRLIAISGNYTGQTGMTEDWLDLIPALSVPLIQEQMPEIIEQYLALNPSPNVAHYVAKTKALWMQPSVISEDALRALQVKTLIVGGDRDFVLPEQLLAMQRLIPKASLLLLPGCDHFIFQDFAYSGKTGAAVKILQEFLLAD